MYGVQCWSPVPLGCWFNQLLSTTLCCGLAKSVGSREHWLWDIVRKRNDEFLLCSIVLRILRIAHNFGTTGPTTGPIQVGFSAKCTSLNVHFSQIENWNCHMFNFRLISLNCITFLWSENEEWFKLLKAFCASVALENWSWVFNGCNHCNVHTNKADHLRIFRIFFPTF